MNVLIVHDWAKDGYDLYIYEDIPQGRVTAEIVNGQLVPNYDNPTQPGEQMSRSLFLMGYQYEALKKAVVGEVMDNDDALQDARDLRDRLLRMIESEWQSRQLEKS